MAAALAALALPAVASAAVLYDQTVGAAGGTVPSSAHSTPAPGDSAAADDFIVPPGAIWFLSSVDVEGQAASPQAANAVLFTDAGARPGTEFFRQGGIPFPSGSAQSLSLSGVPPLPPGHYWISVYTTSSSSGWSWRRQSAAFAFPAVWENPLNGEGTGCLTFTPLTQCGFTAADGTDLVFRLDGEATAIVKRRKCTHRRHKRATSAQVRRCRRKKH
jgi:hypothetical protein